VEWITGCTCFQKGAMELARVIQKERHIHTHTDICTLLFLSSTHRQSCAWGCTYRLFRRGQVRHNDGGTALTLARSSLSTSRAAVPFKFGKTFSSRASDKILWNQSQLKHNVIFTYLFTDWYKSRHKFNGKLW
jgi:hypothetical protein